MEDTMIDENIRYNLIDSIALYKTLFIDTQIKKLIPSNQIVDMKKKIVHEH